MTKDEFYKHFKLIENNFMTMGLDLKMKIRENTRNLSVGVWEKICNTLINQKFEFPAHPIFKDFMDLKREYTTIKEEKYCLRCEGINTTLGNFCSKCEAFLKSPEGIEAVKETRERLKKLFGKLSCEF